MKALVAIAAGVVAGVAAEQLAVRQPWRPDPYADEDFGSVRGQPHWVRADDGTHLYAEVHPAPAEAPTVVIAHGYCLNQDSWHFQRKDLRGRARMVLWDQRGHGRSERGPSDHNSLDQLGRDLRSVIDELAPTGPLTLVGHSMGGMTIMALADQFPDLVQERVFGVGFVATSCGQLSADFAGLPPNLARKVEVALNARQPGRVPLASLIQQVRRTDLNLAATKRNAFGPGAPNSLNRFTVDMLNATPMETVLDFLPTLLAHDKFDALKVFGDIPAFVTCGDADVLTPPSHTRRIASQLPDAQTSVVPGSGHMIQLERSEHITERIAHLAFAADREA